MGGSCEGSPDWLHCFQAPRQSFLTLSSDSDQSPTNSLIAEDDIKHEEPAVQISQLSKGDQDWDTVFIESGEDSPVKPPKSKSLKARAKSETQKRKGNGVKGELIEEEIMEKPVEPKSKSLKARVKIETQMQKGNGVKGEPTKDEILEKPVEPHVSSRLPLVMAEKVQRSKALVECEGDSIDMSGDVGAVGRVVVTDGLSGDPEMLLDLKGTIYKTTIVPTRTFCVVSFNQAEAKIEAVMNDFIQLQPLSNVYASETMIEGTLDGFSFDSEDEGDKMLKSNVRHSEQNNEVDESTNGKAKGKAAKALGVRKGKAAAKPSKKGQRKTQGSRKANKAKK